MEEENEKKLSEEGHEENNDAVENTETHTEGTGENVTNDSTDTQVDNPNDMSVPQEENTPVIPKKADEIDGEINLHNKVTDSSYFKPINYVYDGISNIDDEIERVRSLYLKKMKKSKIFNIGAVAVMLLAFLGVIMVVFFNKDSSKSWLTYTVLAIAAVLIIVSFILTSHFAKKDAKHIQDYLNVYEDTLGGYLLHDMDVQNAILCPDAKIDETTFIQAHCYRTISSIDSRAVMEGYRKNHVFQIAEMAAIIPPVSVDKANEVPVDYINLDGTPYIPDAVSNTMTGTVELQSKDMTVVDLDLSDEANLTKNADKRKKDEEKHKKEASSMTNRYGLFGRFYSYDVKVSSEESVIIYFMGEKRFTLLPDYLTGFKAVKVPGLRHNIIVYVANVDSAKKFFDEKAVELLNNIVPNQVFQSAFVSINSFGTKIGINLSDEIMNIPVKKRQVPGTLAAYKEANDKIFAYIDYIEGLIAPVNEVNE